jgi:UDP-hydrolysing UDP-N-acetyl-D-glucosamine 2-epimerase
MGEDKKRVFITGAPALDNALEENLFSKNEIAERYNLDLKNKLILMVQHPVTSDPQNSVKQIEETLEALKDLKHQTIVIYPNADAGGRAAIKVIEKYKKYPFFRIYKSISHKDYLSLMKIADVMVGNSSSGIIEAPSFHLPVINVGPRQEGRERADNIIDTEYKKGEIGKAVQKALYDEKFKKIVNKCKNPYSRGGAGLKIAKILGTVKIDQELLQKKLTY